MSKAAGGAAEKKEPVAQGQPQGQTHGAPKSEGGKKGERSVMPGGCHAVGCKTGEKRFNFCDEHFDQFKFGLIKKTGEQVSDYEKKFEHYQAYKAKQSARKAA